MPRLVCLLLLASTLPSHAADGQSDWASDLAAAKRLARKENRPIFVVFRCEH